MAAKTKTKTEKTKLTVIIDSKMKKEFAQLCEDIGLPMSAVVSALMSQAVRKQEVKLSSLQRPLTEKQNFPLCHYGAGDYIIPVLASAVPCYAASCV